MDEKMKSDVRGIATDVWNELEKKEETMKEAMMDYRTSIQGAGDSGFGNDWMGLIFGLLLGGGGFNGLNNAHGAAATQSDVTNGVYRVTDNTDQGFSDTRNRLDAGFAANRSDLINLGGQIGNGFDRVDNVIRTGAEVTNANISGVKDAVQNAQFQTALQTKDLLSEFCEVKHQITADGDKTRVMIMENRYADLESKLNETQRERDLLATGNFPIGRPAHVDYWRGNAPEGIEINNINQNVAAIGSAVGQTASQVQGLANEVAAMKSLIKQ